MIAGAVLVNETAYMDRHAGVVFFRTPKWGLGSMVARDECSSRAPSTFLDLDPE